MFLSPGQTEQVDRAVAATPPTGGHAMPFHPDLLAGTPLAEAIHHYRFFSYEAAEGLYVYDTARATVLACLASIGQKASASSIAGPPLRDLIVSSPGLPPPHRLDAATAVGLQPALLGSAISYTLCWRDPSDSQERGCRYAL